MSTPLIELELSLQASIGAVVIGVRPIIRALTIAIVARGHVLVQGVPGLGKTLLSKSLAGALGGRFKRVQGTSDLMPADIIGVHIFDNARGQFEFRRGPLFTDVLLFDEINRTGPKTQSALLEAMEERQVSVDREIYPLPAEFLVIATQNPREFEGTYPLPESQLDRFMMRLTLPYLSREHELDVLARYGRVDAAGPQQSVPATTTQSIAAARLSTEQVHVSPELSAYVLDIAKASREHEQLSLGLSTRGTLALLRAARISAGLNGAEFVSPDDVKSVAPLVLPHRLILSAEAVLDGVGEQEVVARLLEQVTAPR